MFYKIKRLFLLSLFSSLLYASQNIAVPEGYTLGLVLQDKSILLGETTKLTLIYRYKNVEDYEIVEPEFTDIIIQELDSKDYEDGEYSVEEVNYLLTPQKEGKFSLANIEVKTEIIDAQYKNFDNRSKYTKKFSVSAKPLTLEVKKLPDSVTAIGEYRLTAQVDKTDAKSAEVVTLTLSLHGSGNIQNLDALELRIQNATSYLLYTTKSQRQELQTKVYAIISDQAYTIAPFELLYYDKENSIVKKSRTELIKVSIDGYDNKHSQDAKSDAKYLFFFLGVLSVLAIFFLYKTVTKKRVKKELSFIKTIKACSTKNELYKKVVVYLRKDKKLDELIYQLEDENEPNFKAIKKEIVRLAKLRLNEGNDLFFTTKNTL